MPEIYQLRQLAAFAEYGTLSEAAEKLYLSQPALSRNMRKLEEDIGVPLFIRSKNKLELNENGKLAAEQYHSGYALLLPCGKFRPCWRSSILR